MKKEYCIFKEGKLVFTISSLVGLKHYEEDPDYTIIEHEKLDAHYSYTLVDGKIIKGEHFPPPNIPE